MNEVRNGPDSSPSTSPSATSRRLTAARPVVFGEVLFDHFSDGSKVLGGAPFNVAWHLKGFGADPLMLTAVGDDQEGREIASRMRHWDMDRAGVQLRDDCATGRVTAEIVNGEPRFEIAPHQVWDYLDTSAAREAVRDVPVGLVYHGTLASREEGSRTALREVIRASGAPTFVDLNLRDPWWTWERLRWCLTTATWVKLNESELAVLSGRGGLEGKLTDAAVQFAREHAIPSLIVTRGSRGSLSVVDGDEVHRAEASEVEDLADTVGAGDAFSAVLCLGILAGWKDEMRLRRASRFAAEICRIQGATTDDQSLYARHLEEWTGVADRPPMQSGRPRRLEILSLSVHGLVRGEEIELGRDADTGGQVLYVVDQARALASHPHVKQVHLITRRIEDRKIDDSYAEETETLCEGARIVRLPFGPRRYLRKESLWPHLDSLLDQLTRYVRSSGRLPDAIHGHYADAGYVGAQLAKLLGVPMIFTGHSLGRVKRARLIADGADARKLEERYRISQRIEAEERALETAALVIASTRQEVYEQYEMYDHYQPEHMEVIPPGVDLSRFSPPAPGWEPTSIREELARFLRHPGKPVILALARPDERKNFPGLIRAYAETPGLREMANLVLVAGNRDDISEMPAGPRSVLRKILALVDRYDLYGSVAYPKQHEPEDVPDLYRLAAQSGGVFVNPALTEPFGLTLIETAASGLPMVATNDGGPRDILEACNNGLLVDPLDSEAMGRALKEAISDRERWKGWSENGISAAHRHFSWEGHAERYVKKVEEVLSEASTSMVSIRRRRLPGIDRLLVTDVDDTLVGNDEALAALLGQLREAGEHVGFGIATGRPLHLAVSLFEQLGLRTPDVLITASGTQLHYGAELTRDRSWEQQIQYRWEPEAIREALRVVEGIRPGPEEFETRYRLRYLLDAERALQVGEIRRHLRTAGLHATTIVDHEVHLDVLPVRASPGLAIRFFCFKWNLPPERLLVAGDSGNDWEMLSGDTLGVVVGNHTPELEGLRGRPRVYFADGDHAWGILEGVERYAFFNSIRIPEEEESDR